MVRMQSGRLQDGLTNSVQVRWHNYCDSPSGAVLSSANVAEGYLLPGS
jgi:hypothetical protein